MRFSILFTYLFLIASVRAEEKEPSNDFANFKGSRRGLRRRQR
jgi:hypothetical protein